MNSLIRYFYVTKVPFNAVYFIKSVSRLYGVPGYGGWKGTEVVVVYSGRIPGFAWRG
jgi:hypothetical protein